VADLLGYTMFRDVLTPPQDSAAASVAQKLALSRVVRHRAFDEALLSDATFTVFDVETTGTDPNQHHITEIGAIRVRGFEVISEFSSLVNPGVDLAPYARAMAVSGITPQMLVGQPSIGEVIPRFLEFIEGSILCAHNADFDMAFLRNACQRSGVQLQWPCFCSLKMARALMPALDSKGLDTLAKHFGFQFEARHRSIGDSKVTIGVVERLLSGPGAHLIRWKDLAPFYAA
jgi:DNA polymerase III epsilon subunit family exonuclease